MSAPMREPTYFILLALAGGARHGYAITQSARELSDDRVRLAAGTLYGALERLTSGGLVAEDGEETVDGRRRRYYRLTDDGDAALRDEVGRLRSVLRAAEGPLGAAGSGAREAADGLTSTAPNTAGAGA